MQEEVLKPCPLCGSTNVYDDGYTVQCMECAVALMSDGETWNLLPRKSELEQLERERNWLAINLANALIDVSSVVHLTKLGGMLSPDPVALIKAAKEATCQKN